ncbi:hypothetical protein ABIA33_000793 [Streptacidiphilus sp. MAP12-16]
MAAHDPVALAEIDLYGDLIIAAAATPFDRLSADRIDQVLRVEVRGAVEPDVDQDVDPAVRVPPQRNDVPS